MNTRGSIFYKFIKKYLSRVNKVKPEYFLFILTSLFYLLLWVVNPGNKIIVGSFVLFIYLLYVRFKDFRLSLLLSYLVSIIIFTGKRYSIELVPPGVFDPEVFPNGYVLDLIITPGHVLVSIMTLVLLRDFITQKLSPSKIFTGLNLLLIVFFAAIIISDLFGSQQASISLMFSLLVFNGLVVYFYLQSYVKNLNKFLILLIGIISSFIVFESLVSFQQYLAKSPIGKNLESQVNIEYWGVAPDDLEFTFRPVGTFHHANSLAYDMVFWLTFIFITYLKTKDRKLVYIFSVGFIVLVMSLSRSAWIGFTASILTVLFIVEKVKKKIVTPLLWNKKFIWLTLLIPFLFYFFILPRAQRSLYTLTEGGGTFRLEQIGPTLEIIASHPIFGIGRRMLVLEGLDYAPESIFGRFAFDIHNWYLLKIVEHGFPAFIVFMTFLLLSVKLIALDILKKKLNAISDYLRVGILGMVVALLIIGVFQATSGEFYVLTFLGLFNGRNKLNG